MKILFMGTPDFAAESLKALYNGGYDVCAVFTQPDKPKGRGMKLMAGPVKALAIEHGTPVYQPEKLRDGAAAGIISELAPDIIVVVAYGRILPKDILDIPPYGCINIHGSLLPKYRGSAPIQHAVLNGEKVTGVTAMYLAEEMDAGDMIDIAEYEIGEYETSGEVFDKLAALGGSLLCKTLDSIKNGTAVRTPQDHSAATYAPPITKELCPIDWTKTEDEIINKIRGLAPWPVAVCELGGTSFKVHKALKTGLKTEKEPGNIISADENGITVACCGGAVLITELQAAGGKRMKAADYLRGHSLCH